MSAPKEVWIYRPSEAVKYTQGIDDERVLDDSAHYILHSEYEALQAENARLRAANVECVDWFNQTAEENAQLKIVSDIQLGAYENCSAERKALQQQVEALRADAKRFKGLLGDLLEVIDIPEADCRCHRSPPCNDCVEFAGIRDVVATCSAAIQAAGEAWK